MHAALNGILKVMRRKHAMLTYEQTLYSRRAKMHSRPHLSDHGRIAGDTWRLCSSRPKLSAAAMITARLAPAGANDHSRRRILSGGDFDHIVIQTM